MNEKSKNNHELTFTLVFLLILVSAIFIIDVLTPKGYLDWFSYLVVIFYASLKFSRRYLVIIGFISVLLIVLGYFISPAGLVPGFAVINRMIGILIIWMVTSLLYKQVKVNEQKNEIEKQFSVLLNEMSTTGIIYFDTDGKPLKQQFIKWQKVGDAWVWDRYRPARVLTSVRILSFRDVNIEEVEQTQGLRPEPPT